MSKVIPPKPLPPITDKNIDREVSERFQKIKNDRLAKIMGKVRMERNIQSRIELERAEEERKARANTFGYDNNGDRANLHAHPESYNLKSLGGIRVFMDYDDEDGPDHIFANLDEKQYYISPNRSHRPKYEDCIKVPFGSSIQDLRVAALQFDNDDFLAYHLNKELNAVMRATEVEAEYGIDSSLFSDLLSGSD